MQTRSIGVEDALFGALVSIYLAFFLPPNQDMPASSFVMAIVALTSALGFFAIGLQVTFANLPREPLKSTRWLRVFASTVGAVILVPLVLHTLRPADQSLAFLPFPVVMAVWLTVRLINSQSDGNGGPPDLQVLLLALVAEVVVVGLYVAVADSLGWMRSVPANWLVQLSVTSLSIGLAYAARSTFASTEEGEYHGPTGLATS